MTNKWLAQYHKIILTNFKQDTLIGIRTKSASGKYALIYSWKSDSINTIDKSYHDFPDSTHVKITIYYDLIFDAYTLKETYRYMEEHELMIKNGNSTTVIGQE